MSIFYRSLGYKLSVEFKNRKQEFKKDKPCAVCGKIYAPEQMMVAHKTPVREITTQRALFDTSNWEVRCIECERKIHHEEQLRENAKTDAEKVASEPAQVDDLRRKRTNLINARRKYRQIRNAQREAMANRLSKKLKYSRRGTQVTNSLAKHKNEKRSLGSARDAAHMTSTLNCLRPKRRCRKRKNPRDDYYR